MKKIEISPDIKDGSFGLDELHEFFRKFAVEVKQIQRGEEVIIDLSQITFWDISALLWLIIALDYYQKEGQKSADVGTSQKYTLTLRLPQPSISSKTYEQMEKEDLALLKSADYLKRWRIGDALKNLSDNPNKSSEILTKDQQEYYSKEPEKFYKTTKIREGPTGLIQELLSLSLVEIKNLVDFNKPRRKIERSVVNERIDYFIERAVSPVLANQCQIDPMVANKFVTHLLSEALENTLQHPHATIGMFAISKKDDKLILAITDNGDPIPKTIYPHFLLTKGSEIPELDEKYNPEKIGPLLLGKIVTHATLEGVSRKHLSSVDDWEVSDSIQYLKTDTKIGEGLTHIRDTTTEDYEGNLIIATEGIQMKYTTGAKNGDYGATFVNKGFSWGGNLIRIELALKEKDPHLLRIS